MVPIRLLVPRKTLRTPVPSTYFVVFSTPGSTGSDPLVLFSYKTGLKRTHEIKKVNMISWGPSYGQTLVLWTKVPDLDGE